MARTNVIVKCEDVSKTIKKMEKYLSEKGYKLVIEKNEEVFKKGVGFWTAIKYIKLDKTDDTINIYGWIRPVLCKEQDLNGFVGCMPKKQVANVIEELKKI